MKILILIPNLKNIGGVGNYYKVLNLAVDDKIDYFEIGKPPDESTIKTIWRLLYNYIYFISLLLRFKYDIIHVNPSLDSRAFYRDSLFVFFARIFRRKILVFFRGWDDNFYKKIDKNKIMKFIFNKTFLKATKIITLGQIFKEKFLALNNKIERKIIISSTVADNQYLNASNGLDEKMSFDDEINFLFISRLVKSKGIYEAVNLFSEVKNTYKKAKLDIIGNGKEKDKFLDYIKTKNISDIKYHGELNGKDKYEIINKSHILLFLSSHGEGLPNAILESLLYGLVIISSDMGAIGEWINQDNGYVYSSYDETKIIAYIKDLINDPQKYYLISKHNHEYASLRFTTGVIRNKILNIYREIAN